MEDGRRPIDMALDVFIYAPLGLAVSARELLPKLAERGRQQVTGQVSTARVVGQFALQKSQKEAGRAYGRARTQARSTLEQLSGLADASAGRPVAEPDPGAPGTRAPADATPVPDTTTITAETTNSTSGPGAESLAVPDYDSLSASQVLPRLDALSPDELEALRSYEAAHRGRKTILGRISQLQDS